MNIEKFEKALDRIRQELIRIEQLDSFDSHDFQKVYTITCFMKIVRGFQAIELLLENNFVNEASNILRVIMETGFVSRYMQIDFNNAMYRLDINDKIGRNKLINLVKNDKAFEYLKNSVEISKYEKEDVSGQSETKAFDWARLSKMGTTYAYAYRMISNQIHTNLRGLDDYLLLDEQNLILGFKDPTNFDDYERILLTLVIVMVEAVRDVANAFDLDIEDFTSYMDAFIDSVRPK